MIGLILQMLELDEHLGKSKYIDIAKGINKKPESVKEGIHQIKRERAWQLKR